MYPSQQRPYSICRKCARHTWSFAPLFSIDYDRGQPPMSMALLSKSQSSISFLCASSKLDRNKEYIAILIILNAKIEIPIADDEAMPAEASPYMPDVTDDEFRKILAHWWLLQNLGIHLQMVTMCAVRRADCMEEARLQKVTLVISHKSNVYRIESEVLRSTSWNECAASRNLWSSEVR